MAIGRNILSALGGMFNRRPDEEDPLAGLSPEALAGYYGARSRNQANNRQRTSYKPYEYAPSNARIEGDLKLSPGGVERASERSRQKGMRQFEKFDAKVADQRALDEQRREDERAVREAQETAQRNIDRRRSIREGAEDARSKARRSQEARMSRQNLTDAQSGAESDFQDRESRDRILKGIMQDRAKDQAQKQADQALIDANRQESQQRRAEDEFGKDVRHHYDTIARMGSNRRSKEAIKDIQQMSDEAISSLDRASKRKRMERLEGIAQERSADALSQPPGELDLNRLASTEQFAAPELPPEDVKSPYEPSGKGTQDNPYVMEETVITADAPEDAATDDEEEKQGLLGRLGGMVKSNPELFAQIAQLGGGLISGMAQDKAQRRADATTQDRMARANLIGALTGRAPQVAAERADTGGLFSLDTLGKAIKGGGALAQDEIGRREAQEQLDYDRDIAEKETEYQRGQDDIKNAQKWAELGSSGSGGAAAKRLLSEADASLATVADGVRQFEKFFRESGGDEAGLIDQFGRVLSGFATNIGFVGMAINPEKQNYQDTRNLLVGEVARMIAGGRTSDLETRMAESIVPDLTNPRDTGQYGIDKFKNLERLLNLRRDALQRGMGTENIYQQLHGVFGEKYGLEAPGKNYEFKGGEYVKKGGADTDQTADETETEADIVAVGQNLSSTERDLIRRATLDNDEGALEELLKNKKLREIVMGGDTGELATQFSN